MISIDDIVKKEFSRSFLGYDMREVDLFLDAIIEQLEAAGVKDGDTVRMYDFEFDFVK